MMGVGTKDRASQRVRNWETLFDDAKVPFTSYYLGGLGHVVGPLRTPGYKSFLENVVRDPQPLDVHFATTHLSHAERAWVRIEGMRHHYQRASVHATVEPKAGRIKIKPEGITRLSIDPNKTVLPPGRETTVTLDDQTLTVPRADGKRVTFAKHGDRWSIAGPDEGLRKRPGLTGPVMDAFRRPFLCVLPTGAAANDRAATWTESRIHNFRETWSKTFRASMPEKKDTEVTADDRRKYSLILFGDPGSNRVMADVMGRLNGAGAPFSWTAKEIAVGSQTFTGANYAAVLLYPNPDAPDRYVVLNPRPPKFLIDHRHRMRAKGPLPIPIGDVAIIQLSDAGKEEMVYGGFFNESWQVDKP